MLVSTDAREGGTRDESLGKSAGEATQVLDVALSQKNLFMLLAVRLLSYGCTREVWTALKLLEVRSAIALCNFYASFVLSKPPACDIGTLSMNKFLNILNAQILTKIAAVLLLDRHIYMKHVDSYRHEFVSASLRFLQWRLRDSNSFPIPILIRHLSISLLSGKAPSGCLSQELESPFVVGCTTSRNFVVCASTSEHDGSFKNLLASI